MKTKLVALFSFNLAEAHYAHQVLCTTPVELSEDATALHDAFAESLEQIDNLGPAAIFEGDIGIEVTLTLPLLEEIVPLFGRRNPTKDKHEGLDPIDGQAIASAFLDAQVLLNRTKPEIKSLEIGDIIVAQAPAAPYATGLNRIAKFFGNS